MVATRTRLVLLLAAVLCLGACSTKRYLTVVSDPPGARAWVNGEEVGETPVEHEFVHYGVFRIRLEKKGYESLAREVLVPSKIDGYPIVDFPFELAVRERRWQWKATLKMIPEQPTRTDLEALIRKAEAFQKEAREKTAVEMLPEMQPEPFDPVSPGSPPPATPPPRVRRPCAPRTPHTPCTPRTPAPPPPPPTPRLSSSG